MAETRATRLAELKAQLHALSEEGRATAAGSPEREAMLALAGELSWE